MTTTVVDASGNAVTNFNGNLTLSAGTGGLNGATQSPPIGTTVKAVNGVATWSVKAGTVAGATDNFQVTGNDANGNALTAGTLTVTTEAQVPTTISLEPAYSKIEDNVATPDTISAQLLDQVGQPMLSGTYPITFSVSGPGTLSSTSATTWGNGTSSTPAVVTLTSEQGNSGAMTVTATYNTLTASTTVNSQVAGTVAGIQLSQNPLTPGTTLQAGGSSSIKVTLVDANGVPVAAPIGGTVVNLSTSAGTIPSTVTIPYGQYSANVTLSDGSAETDTVTATATGLTSGTTTVTFGVGAVAKLSLSPNSTLNVPVASTSTTLKVQLQDNNGNNVAQAGVVVDFYLVPNSTSAIHTATLGGVSNSSLTSPSTQVWATATTDANGVATVTFNPQSYVGDQWEIAAGVPQQGSINAIPSSSNVFTVNVANVVGASLSGYATVGGVQSSSMNAGQAVTFNFTATDANGNLVPNEVLGYSFGSAPANSLLTGTNLNTSAGTITTDSTGHATLTVAQGGIKSTGAFTVTVKDVQNPAQPSTTVSINVNPASSGVVSGFATYNSAGNELNYTLGNSAPAAGNTTSTNFVNANSGLQTMTIKPVDAYGNPIVASTTQFVALHTNDSSGYFRLSQTGNNVSIVEIPAGSSSITVLYGTTAMSNNTYDVWATPVSVSATTTAANQVTLSFPNASLLVNGALNAADFSLVNGNSGVTVSGASTDGTSVILTTSASLPAPGSVVTVNYTPSGSGDLTFANLGGTVGAFTTQTGAAQAVGSFSYASQIEVPTGTTPNTEDVTAPATATDSNGNTMVVSGSYAITNSPSGAIGVSVDPSTGEVSVAQGATVGVYTVTFTEGTATQTATFTVSAQPDHYTATTAASANSGQSVPVVFTAKNADGSTDTGLNGSLALAATDSQDFLTVPATATFTNGVATVNVVYAGGGTVSPIFSIGQAPDQLSASAGPVGVAVGVNSVHFASNNADATKATTGNTVTLTFTTTEQVTKLSNFKIDGNNPSSFTSVQSAANSWTNTATYTLDGTDPAGQMTFQINVQNSQGIYSQTIEATSDGSSVTVY